MAYINQIVVDGVTYDVEAKALDSTLDATILKKSNLVNGFTQTTANVNALDAAAGKTLNDTKANKSAPTLYFKIGNQDGDPQSSYPHVELRSSGNATSGRNLSLGYYASSDTATPHCLIDKNGNFLPDYPTKTEFAVLENYAEKITGTIATSGTATETVDFSISSTRMLFVGAGTATSSTSDAMRAIAILRNNAATGVLNGTSINISMSGNTLTVKNNGSGTVRYVID